MVFQIYVYININSLVYVTFDQKGTLGIRILTLYMQLFFPKWVSR